MLYTTRLVGLLVYEVMQAFYTIYTRGAPCYYFGAMVGIPRGVHDLLPVIHFQAHSEGTAHRVHWGLFRLVLGSFWAYLRALLCFIIIYWFSLYCTILNQIILYCIM